MRQEVLAYSRWAGSEDIRGFDWDPGLYPHHPAARHRCTVSVSLRPAEGFGRPLVTSADDLLVAGFQVGMRSRSASSKSKSRLVIRGLDGNIARVKHGLPGSFMKPSPCPQKNLGGILHGPGLVVAEVIAWWAAWPFGRQHSQRAGAWRAMLAPSVWPPRSLAVVEGAAAEASASKALASQLNFSKSFAAGSRASRRPRRVGEPGLCLSG